MIQYNTIQYNTLTLPALLYSSENWNIQARDARGITAAEMECMSKTVGYTWARLQKN